MINSNLTFQHYKEPLKAVPKGKGFGYYGAILMTKDEGNIQCHICGETFDLLASHLRQIHSTTTKKYRERFELSQRTSLVSEATRKIISSRLIERWKNPEYRKKMLSYQKHGWHGKNGGKERLEAKNKKGTCPDQILDKIKKLSIEYGYTPSGREMKQQHPRWLYLACRVFGSWGKAVEKAGLTPKERNTNKGRPAHRYSDYDLLEFLRIFYQENDKLPTIGDAGRGLIPSELIYGKRFGGFPKAREMAGLPTSPPLLYEKE